jgi:uncharacterized C2H2 Zn-finger protein
MSNICKVGLTSKTITERLQRLNNTSVASCFILEYYIEVNTDDRFKIESNIHKDIVNEKFDRMPGKEFFKCKPNDIIKIFEKYGIVKYELEKNNNIVIKTSNEKNDNIIIETSKEKNDNICQYCNKSFYQKANVLKHINSNCKIKKQENKQDINDNMIINKLVSIFENINNTNNIHIINKNVNIFKKTKNISQIPLEKINKNIFKCNKCDKIFTRRSHLEYHLLKIKPCDKNKIEYFQPLPIPEKQILPIEKMIELVINSEINKPIIDYKCPHCNKVFYQKWNVKKHLKLNCKIKKDLDNNSNIFIDKIKKLITKNTVP